MSENERLEIGEDLLGINGLDPFKRNTSSPRAAMMATQIGQAPILDGNEPRRIFSGVELNYADYVFDVRIPCDATILKVLPRYRRTMDQYGIQHNPSTLVFYEDYYDPFKTVGVLEIPEYLSMHVDFGYRLNKQKDTIDRLQPGASIAKDTILARSDAVKDNGRYGYGLNAEAAFMSMPGTIEDGFVVSESFLKRMQARSFNKLTANWGRHFFPLNLYGDDDHYKPFPDIGDRVRDDGLVFALRERIAVLTPAIMTARALRTVDYTFDRLYYGKPGAKIVDVFVHHDDRVNPSFTPEGMDLQARKYYDALYEYYTEILKFYESLKKKRGKRLKITPEFNRLVVEAMIFMPTPTNETKLTRRYRLENLDEWRVDLTYEYEFPATLGYKLTDLAGGLNLTNFH